MRNRIRTSELEAKQKALHEKMDRRSEELGFNHDDIAPIYDGVKDANGYLDSKLRILWVMKEPYHEIVDGKPAGGGWELYDFTLELPMFRTMAKIVYGIVNEKYYDEIPEPDEEMLKLLQTTAYINVSKMPGQTSSNSSDLRKKMKDWQDILQEQLETYSPDIIILGNTYEHIMEGHLGDNPKTDWVGEASEPGTTAVLKTKSSQVIIVDAFHPSPMRKCGRPDLSDEKYINSIIKGVLTVASHIQ
ncbi:MAG: hypothetical protein HDR47_08925 [Bacteroides sp.]|nr:hypothetical protein [Bacteroides sp.]